MSREEARNPDARREPAPTGPPPSDEVVAPRPPLFTARTDVAAGAIRTRGHLDRLGADVLCRTVTALQRLGRREIVVRLDSATTTDDDARALLDDLARRLRGDGVRLLLR